MAKVTRTIKLKFLDLNQVKQQMFAQMMAENTRLANELLAMPWSRREMTTDKVIKSLWDGFSCSLDLNRDAVVMTSSDPEKGLLGTARSSDTPLTTGDSVKTQARSALGS